ncbi:hypothetical protein [Fodinicola acaciae]|uniref:hypothetical protein n=1 Tax=Fodinicola acaciae TaxID=2681555 RepID=UPI0013D786D4|nr:hypothetical protein [Fodinicola acaciae]
MSDEYGIPDNMFGYVPPEVYDIVGRITMLAAVLDMKLQHLTEALHTLAFAVGGADDAVFARAGDSRTALIKCCRKTVEHLAAAGDSGSLRAEVCAFLDGAEAALNERNDVVHSVWSNPRTDPLYGWRYARPKQRDEGGPPVRSYLPSVQQLKDLIGTFVALINHVQQLLPIVSGFTPLPTDAQWGQAHRKGKSPHLTIGRPGAAPS